MYVNTNLYIREHGLLLRCSIGQGEGFQKEYVLMTCSPINGDGELQSNMVVRSPNGALLIDVGSDDVDRDGLREMPAGRLSPRTGARRLPELVTYQIGEIVKNHVRKSMVTSAGTRIHLVNLPSHLAPPLELVTYSEAALEICRNNPNESHAFRMLMLGSLEALPNKSGLAEKLQKETGTMLESLSAPLRSVLVMADPASGSIYAATAKSLAHVHEWVAAEVASKGSLDKESELLFLSITRRHDLYKDTFSDLPSESLRVGYGPSLQAPTVSKALYIYNPESP